MEVDYAAVGQRSFGHVIAFLRGHYLQPNREPQVHWRSPSEADSIPRPGSKCRLPGKASAEVSLLIEPRNPHDLPPLSLINSVGVRS